MSFWKVIKRLFPNPKRRKKYFYTLDYSLNEQELRGVFDFQIKDDREQFWNRLSPRERDVTALTCLRYTNLQIAGRLGISIETVRSYLKQVFYKLDLRNKADIRVFFADWDFSAWERRSDPYR